jgi:hypothetical protein
MAADDARLYVQTIPSDVRPGFKVCSDISLTNVGFVGVVRHSNVQHNPRATPLSYS